MIPVIGFEEKKASNSYSGIPTIGQANPIGIPGLWLGIKLGTLGAIFPANLAGNASITSA